MKYRILLIEDDPYDVKLVEAAVRRGGLEAEWTVVESEEEFLASEPVDVIVSDFKLPSFSALRVLELAALSEESPPVIVVTGAIDDELAAECMKRGAADYLLKDRLARLADSIYGAVERWKNEREKRKSERSILESAEVQRIANRMLLDSLAAELSDDTFKRILLELGGFEPLRSLRTARLHVPGLLDTAGEFAPGRGHESIHHERTIGLGMGVTGVGELILGFDGDLEPNEVAEALLSQATFIMRGLIDRYRGERRLRNSLAEKDALLREVQHRVMNNLATIRGLVSIEVDRAANSACRESFLALEGRILSVAVVHELMYESEGFTSIDVGKFASVLFGRVLVEADLHPRAGIIFHADCGGLCIALEIAVDFGILLNELFSVAISDYRSAPPGPVEVTLDLLADDVVSDRIVPEAKAEGTQRLIYREFISLPVARAAGDLSFLDSLMKEMDGEVEFPDGGVVARIPVKIGQRPEAC
jgi:two-component sensor histidine kinase/DNA-binding response OmpR family regulator